MDNALSYLSKSTLTLESTLTTESTLTPKQAFEALPQDVLRIIAHYLSISDIVHLSCTSHQLWKLCSPLSHTVICTASIATERFNLSDLYETCKMFMPQKPLPRILSITSSDQSKSNNLYQTPIYSLIMNSDSMGLPRWVELLDVRCLIMYRATMFPTHFNSLNNQQGLNFLKTHKLPSLQAIALYHIYIDQKFIDHYRNYDLGQLQIVKIYSNDSLSFANFNSLLVLDITFALTQWDNDLILSANLKSCRIHFENLITDYPQRASSWKIFVSTDKCESLRYLEITADPSFEGRLSLVLPKKPSLTTFICNPSVYQVVLYNYTNNWYSELEVIHIRPLYFFQFLDIFEGQYVLKKEMCPKCTEIGLFDKDNKLRILT